MIHSLFLIVLSYSYRLIMRRKIKINNLTSHQHHEKNSFNAKAPDRKLFEAGCFFVFIIHSEQPFQVPFFIKQAYKFPRLYFQFYN